MRTQTQGWGGEEEGSLPEPERARVGLRSSPSPTARPLSPGQGPAGRAVLRRGRGLRRGDRAQGGRKLFQSHPLASGQAGASSFSLHDFLLL